MRVNSVPIVMPDTLAPHLIGYLYEVGPILSGGMGGMRITNLELAAWQSNTGVELEAWEARFIVRLSKEYLGESHRAESPECPSPWTDPAVEIQRAQVGASLLNAMRSMRIK